MYINTASSAMTEEREKEIKEQMRREMKRHCRVSERGRANNTRAGRIHWRTHKMRDSY
mgnify:CR=1 FL=1